MKRPGKECGHPRCPNCGASGESFKLEATGKVERKLFDWQLGQGGPALKPTGPRFSVERDGHDEAEARALCCNQTFMTLAPAIVADAKEA